MTDKNNTVFGTLTPFLKGIGQIMLQENPWTGLLFLAGIFCGSYTMGIATILSVIAGTLTARMLKYDEREINSGLYGFSAALVGVALIVFFQPTVIIWLVLLLGSAMAAVIQHLFIVKNIPAYTFPFILVTWLILFIFHSFPLLAQASAAPTDIPPGNYFTTMALGFGQVIFQGSIWAGVLFYIGVLINSRIAAVYGLLGAAISAMIAYWLGEPMQDIYMGLLGYNAVLCAITFAGRKFSDAVLALLSTVLSVLIMIQMRRMGLPALTFPFVLASWLALIIQMSKRTVPQKLKS